MGETDNPTQPGGGSASEPVPREVYAALDLLERYCREQVRGRYPRAVDFVAGLRRLVAAAGTSVPSAGGIGPGDPGIDPGDDAAPGRGMLSP